jgi:hypothetical protein
MQSCLDCSFGITKFVIYAASQRQQIFAHMARIAGKWPGNWSVPTLSYSLPTCSITWTPSRGNAFMLVQQAENTWWEKDDVFLLDYSENRQDRIRRRRILANKSWQVPRVWQRSKFTQSDSLIDGVVKIFPNYASLEVVGISPRLSLCRLGNLSPPDLIIYRNGQK